MLAIETRSLSKSYGQHHAVKELELAIPRGELFALLGVNGAGKTTTIKLLTGLVMPTAGEARILGHSIVSEAQACKQRIGVSPQESAIGRNLTVRENLELIAGIYQLEASAGARRIQEMLRTFRLEESANVRGKRLSGGMQRRLSLAMALLPEPEVLFLDEPTLGLDVLARRELWASIRQLKGSITMVLTTHYMQEAEELADRVGIMVGGQMIELGTPAELMSRTETPSLEEAFVAVTRERRERVG